MSAAPSPEVFPEDSRASRLRHRARRDGRVLTRTAEGGFAVADARTHQRISGAEAMTMDEAESFLTDGRRVGPA